MRELQRHRWSELRTIDGTADRVPHWIIELLGATTKESANIAYWAIDGVVVDQGELYQAAPAVAACVCLGLRDATMISRPRVLELLVQLTSGRDAASEQGLGNTNIAAQCCAYALGISSELLAIVQRGSEKDLDLAIDIVGACAHWYPHLRPAVLWHFEAQHAASSSGECSCRELLGNWLRELRAI